MSTLLTLTLTAALAAQAAPPARFAVHGSLTRAPAVSPDARFALIGSARAVAPDRPAAGRFSIKSTHGSVTCADGVDSVFKNGFE